MKNIILLLLILFSNFFVFAQPSVDSVLAQIERNNTTLAAYRKSVEADKMGNKSGLLSGNPEVGFNYLWGNPSVTGNRTDFNVRQSFDFPSTYVYRSQLSNLKNEQAEFGYERAIKEILLQSRLLCTDLIYQNALHAEYEKRLTNAQQIADAYTTKFNAGETGILEYNKAQVYLLAIAKDLEKIEIERKFILSELTKLNGGIVISLSDNKFNPEVLNPEFDQWYAQAERNNPDLKWIKQEIAVAQKEKQMITAQNLPGFSAGYMSEKVIGQQYEGITMGITIPLWESKNTLRYAKAQVNSVQAMETDARLQFYSEMKSLHSKAIDLQNSATDYRQKLFDYSNTELLGKALDKGEISLTGYLFELMVYYESIDRLLDLEYQLNKAINELNKYL